MINQMQLQIICWEVNGQFDWEVDEFGRKQLIAGYRGRQVFIIAMSKQQISSLGLSRLLINQRLIKLPPRKPIPLPVLTLQGESESCPLKARACNKVYRKLNKEINLAKLLKIIEAPAPQSGQLYQVFGEHRRTLESRMKARKKTQQFMETSTSFNHMLFRQEIQSTIRKMTGKMEQSSSTEVIKGKAGRSTFRLTAKECRTKRQSFKTEASPERASTKWGSFCLAAPCSLLKPAQPIRKNYLREAMQLRRGSRSVEGQFYSEKEELQGWESVDRYRTECAEDELGTLYY